MKPVSFRKGERTDSEGKAVTNAILLSLDDDEYSHLRPHLEPVELPRHRILHDAGDRIQYAYFLNEGLASLVVITRDGRSVEIAIVGHEGVVGTPLAVGLNRGPYRAIMQIPGSGLRVKSSTLVQGLQVAQIAACNRLHEIEQRLARWLLMCQDRIDSETLAVTHEFLAQMLGTGRPSVSLAAGMLQRAGMIENLRGTVRILNRKNLEDASCECYRAMQAFGGGLGGI